MKTAYKRPFAATLWLTMVTAVLCFTGLNAVAQTGVYALGTANANEGGRVLCDDPANQRMYIAGYRDRANLIMVVDYTGNVLDEMTFRVMPTGTGNEIITDFKFNADRTEFIGTGYIAGALTGYAFRMTPALVLGWVTTFPATAATPSFLPWSVQDLGGGSTEYRLVGTNFGPANGGFVLIDKVTGIPTPGSGVNYALSGVEDLMSSTVDAGNNLYATGRFAHGAALTSYRPGLVELNGNTGAVISQNTYMVAAPTAGAARIYSTDLRMGGPVANQNPITVGFGDFFGTGGVTNWNAFWSRHDLATNELVGFQIHFAGHYATEGAHEVVPDPDDVDGSSIILGQGRFTAGTAEANRLWLMSMDQNGAVNWSREYGSGVNNEYFSTARNESQQQLIAINAGTARLAFTGTTTRGAGNEDILLVMTNADGLFDEEDGNCIVADITPTTTSRVANNVITLAQTAVTPTNTVVFPNPIDPNLRTTLVCGGCWASLDAEYTKISVPTTFDITNTFTGTRVWNGKYYIGADVTIDGITLDVTESDIVFAPCTRISLINGARIRANNSTFRPCDEDQSWEGIFFDDNAAGAEAGGVINECVFKNAAEALRFDGGIGTTTTDYEARITNNLFVNCWRGISLQGALRLNFHEGITGNTFTVDGRTIVWGEDNPSNPPGGCLNFAPFGYTGIWATNSHFLAMVSQNDFVQTSNATTPELTGAWVFNGSGRFTLNHFTNNVHALVLVGCNTISVENNEIELTQLFTGNSTQILVSGSTLAWVTGNRLTNSVEQETYDPARAAISVERSNVCNVKENEVNGFCNGIQLWDTDASAVNENQITNCNIVGIVLRGGSQDTLSCNQIKMRSNEIKTWQNEGIFIDHYVSGDPTCSIKGNCITDASVAIAARNSSGGFVRVPRMHNNYMYNYTVYGVWTEAFDGLQGSGIATPAEAARNTFVSNNLLAGAIDIETGGMPQTWFGNFGVATVSAGVTLVGTGIYESIASCGLQIGAGNSTIDVGEFCDVFQTNVDASGVRLGHGDYSQFEGDYFGAMKATVAAAMMCDLIEDAQVDAATRFWTWLSSSENFSPLEHAYMNYAYHNAMSQDYEAMMALATMEALDPSLHDFVVVERTRHQIAYSGRNLYQLNAQEIAVLTGIDEARGRFADDARSLLNASRGEHRPIEKRIELPTFDLPQGRVRDVSSEQLHIFPNPTKTSVTVDYALENGNGASMRVIDATGRVIHSGTLSADAASVTLDVSTWAPGIYMVSVFNAEGKARTAKLQVQ